MLFIRPIEQRDFDDLKTISVESGIGFTSLPTNDELLQNKITRAIASIQKAVTEPHDEGYLFVLEDSQTGEVLGTCGIEASVGVDDAFYNYHVGKVVHSSRELNIHNKVDILTFCNDYTGMSEICTLFLRDQARLPNVGKFLSKSRFLFIAEHSARFTDKIFAEMRGVSDENGRSPFWEWLEQHFFSLDFPTADYLTGIGNKVFIAELMPKYPIYVNLLSDAAQKVIGQVHEKTKPALALLQKEGFKNRGYVDIFDAGPTVEADIDQIKTVRESLRKPVLMGQVASNAPIHLIINTKLQDYRAICQPVEITQDHIILSAEAMQILKVQNGDLVRISPI